MYTSVGVACSDNRVEWNSVDCTNTSVGVACSDNRVEWNSVDCTNTSVGVACSGNRVEWNSGDKCTYVYISGNDMDMSQVATTGLLN